MFDDIDIDHANDDTVFATAFYELPIVIRPASTLGVKDFNVNLLVPNPTAGAIDCYVLAFHRQAITVELRDNLGIVLRHQTAILEEGTQDITIPTEGLPSGNYWIVLRNDKGAMTVRKAVLVH